MRTNTRQSAARNADRNHEGTVVKRLNPVTELRRSVMSCLLFEDQHYESGEDAATRIAALIPQCQGKDVLEMAVEARTRMKLRHIPLFLIRELVRIPSARQSCDIAGALAEVIQRPDELAEFMALYWKDGKCPIAACVKSGLAAAFQKFDAFQLARYNRDGAVKLRDVLFLCHAKPKDEAQAAVWKQLIDGTLPIPDTWETELSAGKDKKETWKRLMADGKLGALALLRNLRNMLEVGVPDSWISNALNEMRTERVLPFRFIAAARYAPRFEPELEKAMLRCLGDEKLLFGTTAIIIDTSPSMWQAKVSAKSDMDRFDAAAALTILLQATSEKSFVYAFNSKEHEVPGRTGFALRDALAATKGNYSRGGMAVDAANKRGYDRIVVLTDGQWHTSDTSMGEANVVSPAPLTAKAYMVNVAGCRNGVGYGKWTSIDGWSEAIIDYIAATESQERSETD